MCFRRDGLQTQTDQKKLKKFSPQSSAPFQLANFAVAVLVRFSSLEKFTYKMAPAETRDQHAGPSLAENLGQDSMFGLLLQADP